MLNDVLDLEREDIAQDPGHDAESADQLMAFLAELTDEDGAEEAEPAAMSWPLLGLLGLGHRARIVDRWVDAVRQGVARRASAGAWSWRSDASPRAVDKGGPAGGGARGCRCSRDRRPTRSARSWASRR